MPDNLVEKNQRPSFERFDPPKRILLGPGPSPVDDRVLNAMTAPVLGHLDPIFLQCMDDIQSMLRYVFETENRVTFPVSGTGSAGMEAAIVNSIEPGDDVVVCVIGVFGERMVEIVERAGGRPVAVRSEWGEPVDPNQIEDALKSCKPRALVLVHAETSTGVLQELNGLAGLAHARDALLVVDAVASLGGIPWGRPQSNRRLLLWFAEMPERSPGLAPITFQNAQ
jgi:alanine-glyoxylate transaminase/serine-glyoxylate transaminase/serine-pyruvate transaminase